MLGSWTHLSSPLPLGEAECDLGPREGQGHRPRSAHSQRSSLAISWLFHAKNESPGLKKPFHRREEDAKVLPKWALPRQDSVTYKIKDVIWFGNSHHLSELSVNS